MSQHWDIWDLTGIVCMVALLLVCGAVGLYGKLRDWRLDQQLSWRSPRTLIERLAPSKDSSTQIQRA